MSIAQKLETIAQNEQLVYNAGFNEGAWQNISVSVGSNGTVTAGNGYTSSTHQLSDDDDSDFVAENIKDGVTIFGTTGTLETGITPTGNINITDTNQTDVSNYATAQVVDADLVASNIKKDVNILGVVGTLETGTPLPVLTDPAQVTDVLLGKEYIDENGSKQTGTMPNPIPSKGILPTAWNADGRPTDVTVYGMTVIPAYFFYNSDSTSGQYISLTDIDMPSSVTEIGNYAFRYCTTLALTELPSALTTIGNYAFNNCTTLALTELPSALTTIGNSAFNGCISLALTELPDGITSIGSQAFDLCRNIALTELPSALTEIGNSAFSGCRGLTSLTFASTPTIGSNSFYGCTNLRTINVPWAEGEVAGAPWGAVNATINYNYTGA